MLELEICSWCADSRFERTILDRTHTGLSRYQALTLYLETCELILLLNNLKHVKVEVKLLAPPAKNEYQVQLENLSETWRALRIIANCHTGNYYDGIAFINPVTLYIIGYTHK